MLALLTLVLDKEGVAWLVGLQPRTGFLKNLLVHTSVCWQLFGLVFFRLKEGRII